MKKVVAFHIIQPAPLSVRLWAVLGLALFTLFLLVTLPTHAQDETPAVTDEPTLVATLVPEPTVVVTPEPTPAPVEPDPIIVDQTGFRVGAFGFVAIVVTLLLGGAGLGIAWSEIRHSKAAKDSLEMAYESISPDTQEHIRAGYDAAERAYEKFDQLAREVFQFIGEVTDKQPNDAGS